jgi:ribosome-binding protein aMBF1 (putative translation factor)
MAEVNRPRISIDVTPDLRRRIRLAAAARDMSVTEYCREILTRHLRQEADGQDGRRERALEALEMARRFRERVFADRILTPDSAELIREAREERLRRLP